MARTTVFFLNLPDGRCRICFELPEMEAMATHASCGYVRAMKATFTGLTPITWIPNGPITKAAAGQWAKDVQAKGYRLVKRGTMTVRKPRLLV